MRRVVSDTVLHLNEASVLTLLSGTGDIWVPKAVAVQMTQYDPRWNDQRSPWLKIHDLTPSHETEAMAWQKVGLLGTREAEAIALARQINADWLLTDDAAARLFAESLGLEVHGSLGVVLWGAATGGLDRAGAEAALDRLAQSSLWISRKVLAEAKAALNRLCP